MRDGRGAGGGGELPTYTEHKCAITTNRHAALFYFIFYPLLRLLYVNTAYTHQ